MVEGGERVAGGDGVGVGVAEYPFAVAQGQVELRPRLVQPAQCVQDPGVLVPGGQRLGMVVAQDPAAQCEGVVQFRLGLPVPSLGVPHDAKGVAGGQCAGVFRAEHPVACGQDRHELRVRTVVCPRACRTQARLWRLRRVSELS